jgi:hypothetical protein
MLYNVLPDAGVTFFSLAVSQILPGTGLLTAFSLLLSLQLAPGFPSGPAEVEYYSIYAVPPS